MCLFIHSKLRHQAQSERFGYREVILVWLFNTLYRLYQKKNINLVNFILLFLQVVLKGDPKKLNLHGVRM